MQIKIASERSDQTRLVAPDYVDQILYIRYMIRISNNSKHIKYEWLRAKTQRKTKYMETPYMLSFSSCVSAPNDSYASDVSISPEHNPPELICVRYST